MGRIDRRKMFQVTMTNGYSFRVRGWIFSDVFGCCSTPDGISLTHLPTGRTLGFFQNRRVAREVAAYVEKHSSPGLSCWKVKVARKAIPKEVRAWVRERRKICQRNP